MHQKARTFLYFLFLVATVPTACQSITHEYAGETPRTVAPPTTVISGPSLTLDMEHNTSETLLEEEPIVSLASSLTKPILTPASYYHTPDPPQAVPEYVPSLFFEFDSWTLTDAGKHVLELTAAQMKDDPQGLLLIEGHCDVRGNEGYNLVLGDKRALAIRDYLIGLGIPEHRLVTVSFGETHPVCFKDHETCHALNRRGYLVTLNESEHVPSPAP